MHPYVVEVQRLLATVLEKEEPVLKKWLQSLQQVFKRVV